MQPVEGRPDLDAIWDGFRRAVATVAPFVAAYYDPHLSHYRCVTSLSRLQQHTSAALMSTGLLLKSAEAGGEWQQAIDPALLERHAHVYAYANNHCDLLGGATAVAPPPFRLAVEALAAQLKVDWPHIVWLLLYENGAVEFGLACNEKWEDADAYPVIEFVAALAHVTIRHPFTLNDPDATWGLRGQSPHNVYVKDCVATIAGAMPEAEAVAVGDTVPMDLGDAVDEGNAE